MKNRLAISPKQLRRKWDPDALGFQSTAEIPELDGLIGQERAVNALRFGLSIKGGGYHIYVAGPSGTGKTSYSTSLVRKHAAKQPTPLDWVYVCNFDRPDEPLALGLAPGGASKFASHVEEMLQDVSQAIARARSSKEYHGQREERLKRVRTELTAVTDQVNQYALQQGFTLTQTGEGVTTVPLVEGEPMTEAQAAELSAESRRELGERAQEVQAAIAEVTRRSWELERALKTDLRQLDTQVVESAIAPIVRESRERYKKYPKVVQWLDAAQTELIGLSMPGARSEAEAEAAAAAAESDLTGAARGFDPFARFRVNLFVQQSRKQGAPVVIETNPTYANLFGKAEFAGHAGQGDAAGREGVRHIKAGAIHRANGGFLILQAIDLLRSPHAWDALKRALSTREARIEVPDQENRILPVGFVRPRPIPLDLKVLLIGSSVIFHTLFAEDETFRKLFKLRAEFDVSTNATEENVRGYAGFLAQVCRRDGLRQATAGAVAAVLDHSHRLSGDQEKLSTRFNEVVEVIYEADAWAQGDRSDLVEVHHVKRAIAEKSARSALPVVRLREMIRQGTLLVDVAGEVVGQVNGLTVMSLGDFAFGSPSRITARVYMGQKGILHIEREIEMSGQIHGKGLLTLSAFLGDRFAQNKPLSFSASIAFEQTYRPVDGDSASSSELYALLSALSQIPIDQGIAVTGSVNQRGQVQPIGGVNEKIEGFFGICQTLGLTGRQGVMIPRRNLANLALNEEVVEAVAAGQFHVWAVDTIEEGIEVLTGVSAGVRGSDDRYPQGTLFALVDQRIESLARNLVLWNKGTASLD